MNMASAALLLAASQLDRLDWAAQMLGINERMAAKTMSCWQMNREVKAMVARLEPQIRRCAIE